MTAVATRIDPSLCDEIRRRLPLSSVAGRSVSLKKRGREFSGLCPFHGEKTGSFTISDAKGFFHCFGCGAHGDVIGFVMRRDGLRFADAVAALARECGLDAPGGGPVLRQAQDEAALRRDAEMVAQRNAVLARERRSAAMQLRAALTLWRQAKPLWNTRAQFYLEGRGIAKRAMVSWWAHGAPIRFVPELLHVETRRALPAMLAAIVTGDGENRRLIGLHRTFLSIGGTGKAAVSPNKKVLGNVTGGTIRLAPAGEHLVLAEGIETALSVMQATGLPAWAGVSLGNMAGRGDAEAQWRAPYHPTRRDDRGRRLRLPTIVPDMDAPGIQLPAIVRKLTIAADNDSRDPEGARCLIKRAAARFALMGLEVSIAWPPAGSDFNDVLRRSA